MANKCEFLNFEPTGEILSLTFTWTDPTHKDMKAHALQPFHRAIYFFALDFFALDFFLLADFFLEDFFMLDLAAFAFAVRG